MKQTFAILCFLFSSFAAFSQKDYFVYIQSDNRQPFYILMDGKTHSSSESGYVILSSLQGQAYKFVIGFPNNAFPEQTFILNVYNKDAGYQLKNFGEKGWGLFNYQTLEVIMNKNSESGSSGSTSYTGVKKTDAFSLLLSNVVNDSSILYQSIAYQEPLSQTQPVAPAPAITTNTNAVAQLDSAASDSSPVASNQTPTTVSGATVAAGATVTTAVATPAIPANNEPKVEEKDSAITSTPAIKDSAASSIAITAIPEKDTNAIAAVKDTVAETASVATTNVPVAKKEASVIKKITEFETATTHYITYTDSNGKSSDTIHISIMLMKEDVIAKAKALKPELVKDTVTFAKTDSVVIKNEPTINKTETQQTTANPDIAAIVPKTEVQPVVAETKPVKMQINNSDCKNTATENDIDKLRVKLLSLNSTEEKNSGDQKAVEIQVLYSKATESHQRVVCR